MATREGDRTQNGLQGTHCTRELVEVHYPDTEAVQVVLDNLSLHQSPLRTKHAGWINTMEIEIGALDQQRLDRRIPDRERSGILAHRS